MAKKVSAINADTMDESKQRRTAHWRYSNLASYAGDDHVDEDNEGVEHVDSMTHSGGLQATENALPYNEHQGEATAKDELLSRRCCGLAARKMEIHKHPLRSSQKMYSLIQSYIMLNNVLVHKTLLFHALLYFIPDLMPNLSYALRWYLPLASSTVFRIVWHFPLIERPLVPFMSCNRGSTAIIFRPEIVCFGRNSPAVGHGLLIHEVSRSHITTHHNR